MSNQEPEIFVYKMVVDNGGAPCVSGNLLSLAICKPKIRSAAEKGSLIFGFGGQGYGERLIYIAEVTEKLKKNAYYSQRKYATRPDCIYRVKNGKPVRKRNAKYHADSDQRTKDVGRGFKAAFVLLSDDFRYLGVKSTAKYREDYPELSKLIQGLKQGHRRHFSVELRKELLALKAEVWKYYRRKKVGNPTDDDFSGICNRESPSASC